MIERMGVFIGTQGPLLWLPATQCVPQHQPTVLLLIIEWMTAALAATCRPTIRVCGLEFGRGSQTLGDCTVLSQCWQLVLPLAAAKP
jgi:hypothetical protein